MRTRTCHENVGTVLDVRVEDPEQEDLLRRPFALNSKNRNSGCNGILTINVELFRFA